MMGNGFSCRGLEEIQEKREKSKLDLKEDLFPLRLISIFFLMGAHKGLQVEILIISLLLAFCFHPTQVAPAVEFNVTII